MKVKPISSAVRNPELLSTSSAVVDSDDDLTVLRPYRKTINPKGRNGDAGMFRFQ